MYTDAARTPGGHRRHPPRHDAPPCQGDHHHHCDRHEPWLPHHQQYYGGPGCYPTSARGGDHPSSLDLGRDIWAPSIKDAEVGRAPERSGHPRNPQRRPVFAGQPAPGDRSHHGGYYPPSWDVVVNPAPWRCPPPEPPGFRHYPSVREQCGCVMRGGGDGPPGGARPFDTRPPPQQQPLPPSQFKGHSHRRRRIVKYVSRFEEEEVEEEEEEDEGQGRDDGECCRRERRLAHAPDRVHVANVPNGHHGPRPAYYDGWESDSHQDWSRWMGGSEECCNGRGGPPPKGFFSTEVPQKHLNQNRRKGIYVPPPENAYHEPLKQSTSNNDCRLNSHRHQDTEPAGQRGKQDSVRDQIRQVVTDLEDVLGGLKQVHVEMKEVVEQIDRLTVNMDLSEEVASVTQGGSGAVHHSTSHPGHLNMALVTNNHNPASSMQVSQQQHSRHVDHIILRTNSPSPIHMASVVKTNRIAQPGHGNKDPKHDRPHANGHPPPHPYAPPRDSNHVGPPVHPGPHHPPLPHSLDPTVVIGKSTAPGSKTQKPPPYPQNGRCGGKGPPCQPPIVPLKMNPPPHPRRGRQSTSMV